MEPVSTSIGIGVIAVAGAKTALILIGTGACLALGFWAAKKLTNQSDAWLDMRDPEVKKFIQEHSGANEPVLSTT